MCILESNVEAYSFAALSFGCYIYFSNVFQEYNLLTTKGKVTFYGFSISLKLIPLCVV